MIIFCPYYLFLCTFWPINAWTTRLEDECRREISGYQTNRVFFLNLNRIFQVTKQWYSCDLHFLWKIHNPPPPNSKKHSDNDAKFCCVSEGYEYLQMEDKPFDRDPSAGEAISEWNQLTGSTIITLLHEKIKPKNWQVLSFGDVGFFQFLRVVSSDYGKPETL